MVPVNVLMRGVAQRLDIPLDELVARPPARKGRRMGDTRSLRARQVIQFVAHRKGRASYSEIGRRLSYDHATVMHNVRRVSDFLQRRDELTIELYRTVIRVWTRLRLEEEAGRAEARRTMATLLHPATIPTLLYGARPQVSMQENV